MAKLTYDEGTGFDANLDKLGREGIKAIVMAGAEGCAKEMQGGIRQSRHVRTGSMMQTVRPGNYHEDPEASWCEVYPQGSDARGVSNAKKAFVINYGYGKRRTDKTGDKFITGNKKKYEASVAKAMQDESDRVVAQLFNT